MVVLFEMFKPHHFINCFKIHAFLLLVYFVQINPIPFDGEIFFSILFTGVITHVAPSGAKPLFGLLIQICSF